VQGGPRYFCCFCWLLLGLLGIGLMELMGADGLMGIGLDALPVHG